MTRVLHADVNHVGTAVSRIVDQIDFMDDEDATILVYDSEAVMRGIPLNEVGKRNLSGHLGDSVCQFTYDGTTLSLGIHQNTVEGTFELRPRGPDDMVGTDNQATPPRALAPAVRPALDSLEEHIDVVTYDFAEVSAASISSLGHLTDFEFEYEVTSTDV